MLKLYTTILVILMPFFFNSCSVENTILPIPPTMDVASMAYVINGADINTIAKSNFKAAIIDYSQDGSEEKKYTVNQINQLKDNTITPIAYLSIGEAEDYRFYWQEEWDTNPPEWLDEENPEWVGNYNVKFWDDDWKSIVFQYIDKILEQGFSGIMLDRVDSYYYWSEEQGVLTEQDAAEKMINFVVEIGNYIKTDKGYEDFKIISQNALGIFQYDVQNELKKIICGVSIESLFFMPDGSPTDFWLRTYRLGFLEMLKQYGKLVFVTDYVYPINGLPEQFIDTAKSYGFIPYAAHVSRQLNELIVIENLQP